MYADCWDCEVQTTYGWIECAGLADRSAFDLTVHSKASKTELVAYDLFDTPKQEDVVEVEPQMKVMGKTLKQAAKAVVEHLAALAEEDALALKVRPGRCAQLAAPRGDGALCAVCQTSAALQLGLAQRLRARVPPRCCAWQ